MNNHTLALQLLNKLMVVNYTNRHINLIADYIESGNRDAKELLQKLGSYDDIDLKITEMFFKSLPQNPIT